jgi:hypothetical protein
MADGLSGFPYGATTPTERANGRVKISCLVSDLEFRWQLREAGDLTEIEVHVLLPDAESHWLPTQRRLIAESVERLALLAAE